MIDDLYCKVYVDAPMDMTSFRSAISEVAQGHLSGRTVTNGALVIDIFKGPPAFAILPAAFLGWPYYLEIEPENSEIGFEAFLNSLVPIMHGLMAKGMGVVPSCDFEDQLPSSLAK